MQSRHQMIEEDIKEKILTGQFEVEEKLPTESELMKEYDAGRSTVRRAIGDLENKNFVYRIQGSGMFVNNWKSSNQRQTKKSPIIGVITTYIGDYIFPRIINGIDQVISEKRYTLLLANTHNDPERERRELITLLDNNVSGLIIEPTQSNLESPNIDLYEQMKKFKIPAVFINAKYPNVDSYSITTNDKSGVRKLTSYLMSQGHKSILGVFQVDDHQGTGRMLGYIQAYQEHASIDFENNILMYQSNDNPKKVLGRIKEHLNSTNPPTAIVCYNDQLAISVIEMVKSMGLSIPEDISITGFDDYEISKYISPSITTMTHAKEKMGVDAANLLVKLMEGEKGESIVYESEIVVRESVRRIED